jgi:signal transduction histidine kinase/ligand-binding sensor domain-containing protein
MPARLTHCLIVATLWAVIFSGCWQAGAATDATPWSFRAWQTDEGLPDDSVTGVEQTPDGFLWVATYGGLLRFDGAKFEAISQPGLLRKSVRTFLLDGRGRFWLGMDSGSVICLESNVARTFTTADGLPGERVQAMASVPSGAVWIAFQSELCRIQAGRVTQFGTANGWPSGINASVASDVRGNVWYSKGGQVGQFHDGKLLQKLFFDESMIRLCGSTGDGLWICAGSRLMQYDGSHPPVELARLPASAKPQILFEDRSGTLWIGTMADGLFRFANGALEKIPTSHPSVYCLSEDREGNLWAGTSGGGLNLIRPAIVELIGRDTGLPFEAVASVCEDTCGWIWVASQSGALTRHHDDQWEMVGANAGWTNDAATCVAADKKAGVWVGARNRTLNYFNNGIWRTWRQQAGLHNGAVHLIFVARNDDVWVVTGSPSRLQRLHDGKLEAPLSLPAESRTIRAMAEDVKGTLWLGTLEGQVLRVNGSSLIVEPAATQPDGLPVRALETTPDGALWIGYAGGGVGRLKDGQYSRITTAEGLADDFAAQILADDHDRLWIVGNHGLFQVPLGDLTAVAEGRAGRLRSLFFGRNEGLPNFQPNTASFPNVCLDRNGRLWFASRSGLLTVRPEILHNNTLPPPVVLERVTVDDKTVALYDARSPLHTGNIAGVLDLSQPNAALRLPPRHRKVEFDFAALSFTSPENVQFRYRLDNFDDQWVDAGREHTAKYPHLPPGNYQFRVIACNNSGIWNETGAGLKIVVEPFFWQTWWFRGLTLLLFTAGVVAVVRYVSFRRLRARMALLEKQAAIEKERTRIARDMHDEVGAKLTRLSLLTEMAGGNPAMPETARGDVREIADTARETIRSFEEVVWAVNPRNDTLADLVHYLCRYAEDYFEGSSVRCEFDLPPEIPSVVLPTEVRQQVFMAAKEACNNVLKHSRASRVCVRFTTGADEFKISVEDDGCGFDLASPPKRTGGGNGLANMRERLRGIGGRLECLSQPGQGTRIILAAPTGLRVTG